METGKEKYANHGCGGSSNVFRKLGDDPVNREWEETEEDEKYNDDEEDEEEEDDDDDDDDYDDEEDESLTIFEKENLNESADNIDEILESNTEAHPGYRYNPVYDRHIDEMSTGMYEVKRDIKAGEEIFSNYLPYVSDHELWIDAVKELRDVCKGA